MPGYFLPLAGVAVVGAIGTCGLLIALELAQAARMRAIAERRLMQVRFEIRKLRQQIATEK